MKVAQLWRRLRRARAGYADLNRATHGAFGFNTAAKALAWAGLCAIVVLLLHKVHQIQLQLDPVGQGLAQLQQELRSAKATVESDAQASGTELEGLRTRALSLEAVLDKASRQQRDGSTPMLLKAEQEAHDLAEATTREHDAFQSVVTQRERMATSLTAYQDALERGEATFAAQLQGLADGGASTDRSLQALSEAAQRGTTSIDAAVARMKVDDLSTRIASLQTSLEATQRQVAQLNASLAAASQRVAQVAAPPKPVSPGPQLTAAATADP